MDKCAVCHQENGLGLKNEDSHRGVLSLSTTLG
ncbi:hypothetical protein ACJPGL_001327 [Campylobacter jejuni]|nr:hypothetical protein [Campylobacter jejuni]